VPSGTAPVNKEQKVHFRHARGVSGRQNISPTCESLPAKLS
jgi:hypothetical protein